MIETVEIKQEEKTLFKTQNPIGFFTASSLVFAVEFSIQVSTISLQDYDPSRPCEVLVNDQRFDESFEEPLQLRVDGQGKGRIGTFIRKGNLS